MTKKGVPMTFSSYAFALMTVAFLQVTLGKCALMFAYSPLLG